MSSVHIIIIIIIIIIAGRKEISQGRPIQYHGTKDKSLYLPTPMDVPAYNNKIILANNFI